MELQIFTFFILAFVALTDGVPRKMDGSIDMTKPEHAKADLARKSRDEDEVWVDQDSEEGQRLIKIALDWRNSHPRDMNLLTFSEQPYHLVEFVSCLKKPGSWDNYTLILILRAEDWETNVILCPYHIVIPGLDDPEKEFQVLSDTCGPPGPPFETTPPTF